jgi:ubiquinone/menaquinone biosynthesis C-methylase UbiE
MDATKLQFHDAEFNVVASSMITHHIPRWEQAFGEMIRVLRPGGYLIYSDFMFPSWLAAAGRRLLPFAGFPSRKRTESLATQAGLTMIHQSRAGLRFDFIWLRNR